MGSHRTVRAVVGAVLAAGGLVASAAGVGAAPPPPADTGPVCTNVPDGYGGFGDIGSTGNEDNIECLAYAGVTAGTPGGGYNPSGVVTRGQMATFIARALDTVAELDNGSAELQQLPASGPDAFTDDDGLQPHEANINRLAAAGIVSGAGGGKFNPGSPVNRAQMATFINNAQEFLTGERFTSSEDFFTDDDGTQPHEANINGIAAAGIAQGVGADRYGPGSPVTRNQMASFLIRYLAVLHASEVIDPLPVQAPGEGGLVDGSLAAAGESCSWTDGVTSAAAPAPLTIDRTTVSPPGGNGTCTSGVGLVLHNDPSVTFDDGAGTATVDEIDVTIVALGLTCRYRGTDATLDRDGDTRTYTDPGADFALVDGDVACPPAFAIAVELTFH